MSAFSRSRARALGVGVIALALGSVRADEGAAGDAAGAPLLVLPYATLHGELPQSIGDKVSELIAGELKARDEFTMVQVGAEKADNAAPSAKAVAGEPLADAKAALEKAAGLAKKNKFKPAAEAYAHAIGLYRSHADALTDVSVLTEAYLQYAVAELRSGLDDDSEQQLRNVIRLDPARHLDAAVYPAGFIRNFENIRKKMLSKPRGDLKVVSAPSGGKVWIDGAQLGETPLLVKELLPGEHFVRVERGGAVWGAKVDLAGGGEAGVQAQFGGGATGGGLAGVLAAVSSGTITAAELDKLKGLAKASKAQYVLFGAVGKDDDNLAVSSFVYSVKDHAIAPLVGIAMDTELLGAAIEVLKLADDLAAKLKAFPKDAAMPLVVPGPRTPGAGGAASEEKVTVVSAAPPPEADAKKPAAASAEPGSDAVERALAATEPATSAAPPAAKPPSVAHAAPEPEKSAAAEPEAPARAPRERAAIPQPVDEKPAPKAEPTPIDDLDAIAASRERARGTSPRRSVEEPVEAGKEAVPIDDVPGARRTGSSHIALYTVLGVVAVAALATGGYLLATSGSAPSSATATVTWTH